MIFCPEAEDPEGPVCLPDGGWLFTEMTRGTVSRVAADGTARRCVASTGRPNGLALDREGAVWVAESRFPALLKATLEGDVTAVSTGPAQMPFLWPNDLCFGPDGAVYMTDSGILFSRMEALEAPEAAYDLEIDGRVFRIDPESGAVSVIDRGLSFANGIAFGPGGEHLYVSETLTGNIYRYRIDGGQREGARELFGNVMLKPPREYGRVAGPDGLAFDAEGNLYVAVLIQGDITILDGEGRVGDRVEIDGTFPTNVAFAYGGERFIVVTEGSKNRLLKFETPTAGLPLFS